MELLQLKYFQVIARYENISKAAKHLRVSQPSLSSSLIRLEKELGYPLFDRNGRRISLNNYGRHFLKNVQQIINLLNDSRIPSDADEITGNIAIAFQNHNDFLLRQIQEFHSKNPSIGFYIYQCILRESFSLDSYDFILCNANYSFPSPMDSIIIGPRSWYVAISKKSPLAKKKQIAIEELQNEPLCFLQDNNGTMEDSYRIFLNHGIIPKAIITTNSSFYKMRLISYGNLTGLIPDGWYQSYREMENIALIPLEKFEHYTDISMYWRKDRPLSASAVTFLEFVKSTILQ